MGSKRIHHAGGSATPKPTDLTPKSGSHKIESENTQQRSPVKAGRNMGGRNILGERVNPSKRNRGR
ncbi:MAG: hypothetical protein ACTHN5_02075 [Phycisphaerae bacterium]